MTARGTMIVLLALFCFLLSSQLTSATILTKCQAAKELGKEQVIDRTFISQFVCLMHYDGDFNTSKISDPGTQSTRMYGVFQIRSSKYCSLSGDGGLCKKNCRHFVDNKLRDDMICAKTIFETEGLNYWKNWQKKCKSKPYDISTCKYSSRFNKEEEHDNTKDFELDSIQWDDFAELD